MRRGVAMAALVLASAVAMALWWWPSCGEVPPAEVTSPQADWPPSGSASVRGLVIGASPGATPGSAFTGRVVASGDGRPIPRATVTFFLDGAHDVVTDGEGAFRFEAPRPGTYELRRVAADGYAPFTVDAFQGPLRFVARPGTTVGGIQLELSPLVRCAGTIFRDGEPVPRARVQCTDGEEPISEVVAGEDGAYAIMCARRHALAVAGEHPMNMDAFGRVDPDPECRWDAWLSSTSRPAPRPDRVVNVRVVDARGRPVPRAVVVCTELEPGEPSNPARDRFALLLMGPNLFNRTDEMGVMQCRKPEGKDVSAFVRGVPSSERRAPPDVGELTLEVPGLGRLQGRVRDFDGKPVGAFRVIAHSEEGQLYQRPFISADGTFDLGELVPGEYEVMAEGSGLPPSRDEWVEVSPGTTSDVDLMLEEGRTIRGVVLDARTKRPISGARISPPGPGRFEAPMSEWEASATTDLNGRFVMSRVAPGRDQSLVVSAPGYNQWEVADIELQLRELTVELTPAGTDAGTDYGGVGLGWRRPPVVGHVFPNGPADRAGVAVGDRLVQVDGAPAPEDVSEITSLVRGPVGTLVELRFDREDGGVLDVSLRRERITQPW